jgi:tungstate transport system ATP-binding protein
MQDSPRSDDPTAGRAVIQSGALPFRFAGVGILAGATRILAGIDLVLDAGPPTVVMGPNGAGKTTLLKLAMGLIAPTEGRITFAGQDLAAPGSRAIVFQKPVMLRRSAAANIAFALAAAGRRATPRDVEQLLDLAGIAHLSDRPARRLSGGEQQRLALARALARRPQVLCLDEPTASLDPAAAKSVEELIARVSAMGVKIVLATHDLGQARRLAGEVVFLVQGRLVEHTPAPRFFINPTSGEASRFLAGDLVI